MTYPCDISGKCIQFCFKCCSLCSCLGLITTCLIKRCEYILSDHCFYLLKGFILGLSRSDYRLLFATNKRVITSSPLTFFGANIIWYDQVISLCRDRYSDDGTDLAIRHGMSERGGILHLHEVENPDGLEKIMRSRWHLKVI